MPRNGNGDRRQRRTPSNSLRHPERRTAERRRNPVTDFHAVFKGVPQDRYVYCDHWRNITVEVWRQSDDFRITLLPQGSGGAFGARSHVAPGVLPDGSEAWDNPESIPGALVVRGRGGNLESTTHDMAEAWRTVRGSLRYRRGLPLRALTALNGLL